MGVYSKVISFYKTFLGYYGDINLDLDSLSPRERSNKIRNFMSHFLKHDLPKYDIIHIHFLNSLSTGDSFGGWNLSDQLFYDLKIAKDLGKKIVCSAYGSDVQNISKIVYYQLKFQYPHIDLPYPPLNNFSQIKKISALMSYVDVFVTGTTLINHLPYGYYITMPFDVEFYDSYASSVDSGRFTILHAPSNSFVKGTRFLDQAIEKLRLKYNNFDYILVKNMPHDKAISYYPGFGVAVDQINYDFGLVALEYMYYGRPVICCFRKEEFQPFDAKYNAPIVSVFNQEELLEVLEKSIRGEILYNKEDLKSYVLENFAASLIASKYKELYEILIDGGKIPQFVNPNWFAQYQRFLNKEPIDKDNYYSKVTDFLLSQKELSLLLVEIQNGFNLASNVELLAKLILAKELLGDHKSASALRNQNASLVASEAFRSHYERAKEIYQKEVPDP